MAFSTQGKQHQLFPNHFNGGATSAPPPTPSSQPNNLFSTSNAADALSLLFNRLPPTLSLPTRRSSSTTTTTTCPSLSISSVTPNELLNAVSQLGYFQLTDHSIPSELVNLAESEALALFKLSRDQKESWFPKNWPFGYEGGDDDNDEDERVAESFRFDSLFSTESSNELVLDSLREFARALEKLGLNIIDELMKALGIENPVENGPNRFSSLMWVSDCLNGNKPGSSGGFYPFIVGLQFQLKAQKLSLLSDSGWVSVLPQMDSILVTLGDIAQVWSNGKLKKVRGRPVTTLEDKNEDSSRSITMSLLITLPTESTVAPLLPKATDGSNNDDKTDDEEEESDIGDEGEKRVFKLFDFEDYAWRVYHERLHFKDPLDRYRVTQKLELPFTS